MAKMMLATTSNSTSIHFGLDHMCRKHNVLFTMEHAARSKDVTTSGSTPGDSKKRISESGILRKG
jgi:hypothetical protein